MTNAPISRRKFIKRITLGTLGLFGITYGGYYYARQIEPSWIQTTRYAVQSKNLPETFDGFKILQFSDTHLGFQFNIKQLKKMINEINNLNADLIVFTGDLIDNPSSVTSIQLSEIKEVLSKLKAPFGKFWIYGNHDHGGYGTSTIRNVMSESGFTLLKNQTQRIQKDDDYINLSGLDDILLGSPRVTHLISDEDRQRFNLLLCHEPDFADYIKDFPFDVQLSGHSHGGQIQLPFVGHIVTPRLGTQYVEGHYSLGERPLHLFVSRGIGTTRLPFRFLCRPELNLYTLQSTT